MSDFDQSVRQTAERILAAVEAAPLSGNVKGLTAWDLKLELKVSNSALFLALGWLVRDGKVSLEPHDFTFKVALTAHATPTPGPLPPAPTLAVES